MDRSSARAIENINIRENNGHKVQIHDIENSSNNSQEVNECLKKIVSGQIEENNNEIDIDDFMDDIIGSDYYEKLYNNKEEKTNIHANSKSNRTSQCNQIDELENKAKVLFEISRKTKKDKCPKCGAVWSSYVVFIGVHGEEVTLTCQKCDTNISNISACSRVLPKMYSQ